MTTKRCTWAEGGDAAMQTYHDREWGVPHHDDRALFELLTLEGAQAGLSWRTILLRRDEYRHAYHDFDIARVAGMRDAALERLLASSGIIRNRLKVQASIENAKRILALRETHGSFAAWLDAHHPRSKEEWLKLFRKSFVFTGGEIVGEFLMSLGYLPGAHVASCPIAAVVLSQRPPWSLRA